jgi:hypothetical protein
MDAIMNAKLFLLCLGLTGSAIAAESTAPVPMPLAPSPGFKATAGAEKPGTLRRMLSPKISVTSVTRNADGSLSMNCVEKPNPKAQALNQRRALNPQPQANQQ